MSDYNEFLKSKKNSPPQSVTAKIHERVMDDINPGLSSVFSKFLMIHVLMGSMTLIICPQFGIGPLGGGIGIMRYVESLGRIGCGLFCGAFFFLGSLILASFLLSKSQKRVITQHAYGMSTSLAFLSFLALILFSNMANGHIHHMQLEFIIAWLAAGIGLMVFTSKKVFKIIYL